MPIDVRMPDGTLVKNVPDNITQADLLARYNAFTAQPATPITPAVEVTPQAPQVGPEGAPIPSILKNQEPPVPEQTLLQKLVGVEPTRGPKGPGARELASDIYQAAKQFPEQLASSAIQAYQGKDAEAIAQDSTANKIVDDARKSAEANMSMKGAEDTYTDFLGAKIKRSDIRNLPQNLSFSLVAMGSALLSGLGTTVASAPVAGPAAPLVGTGAGAAAAGKVAYNIDTNSFLRDFREGLNQASIEQRGIPITNEEFVKIAQSPEMQAKAKEFNLDVRGKGAVDELAKIHGLHEAGWEAISSTVGLGAGKYIFKEALKGKILKPVAAFTGELGLELAGETATQLGQSNVERKAGMHQDAERSWSSAADWKKSYEEVAGPTVLTTALLGGVPAIAGAGKRAIQKATQPPVQQERVEPEITTPEAPSTPPPIEPAPVVQPTSATSHDTQAMLDELSGKEVEFVPEEAKAVEEVKATEEPTGVISETEKEFVPVGGRLINKADADKLARESAIALQQNLATQEAEKEKQLKQEAREEKFREPPTQTLSARLVQEGGISREQKRDMLGETGKVENYDHVFRVKGNDLLTLVKDGKLDDYLPPNLRTTATPPDGLYDARPGYNYISDMIKTGEKVHTYEYEMAKLEHENMVYEKNLAKQQMTPNEAARAAAAEVQGKEYMNVEPSQEVIPTPSEAKFHEDAKTYVSEVPDWYFTNQTPSFKIEMNKLRRRIKQGSIKQEDVIPEIESIYQATKKERPILDRQRGAAIIKEKLLAAKRRKELSPEMVDMAEWFINKNPDLVQDLALSIRSNNRDGVAGGYLPLSKLAKIFKYSPNDMTAVHEMLHHTERMMPKDIQEAIRKAWSKSLQKDSEKAFGGKNEALKQYYRDVIDFHTKNDSEAEARAMDALANNKVSYENYKNFNPSEFWATKGSEIVQGRYKADISDSIVAKIKNWLKEFIETVKGIFNISDDAAVIKALNSLAKSDGKFITDMIHEGKEAFDIKDKTDINTPEFKKWFAGSEVVDKKGNPLEVYHGTLEPNIQEFKPEFVGRTGFPDTQVGEAYFFSNQRLTAEMVAETIGHDKNGRPIYSDTRSTVMPVYLSMENPLVFKAKKYSAEDTIDSYRIAQMIKRAKAEKRDGVIYKSPSMGDTYVAFKPEQIKSVYNKGAFDRANKNIYANISGTPKNFKGQEVLPQWHGPEESKIDEWIYRLQNKQIDTKRVQELIGDIEEDWNVYEKEQLYHGRTAAGIRNFLLKELLPVIKEIERLKISPEDVRTYLHNRHAEERNIQMNKINPDIYDEKTGKTIPNPLKDKGSGISTADARAYLAGLDPARKQVLERIATKFDQMVKGTQQILINSGAESADTIAKWNSTYEHYVPLFRVEDEMARPTGMGGTGQGFGVRGAFSKRAMGSEKDVQDILSNIIAQRERALIRAEKIRVGRALYGLAIQNPNPDFWLPINPDAIRNKKQAIAELRRMGVPDAEQMIENLMAEPRERYLKKTRAAEEGFEPDEDFDFDSGLPVNESKEVVASKINVMARYKDYVFPVRINGKDRYIFFNKNDPRALRMVQSLKNLDVEQLGILESLFGKATRWFKNVNTQYNPVFGLVNFLRDLGGTFLNLTTTEIKGKQAQVIAGAYKAMGGILNVHRAERKGKPLPTGPWAKLYQEYRDEGSQTGYRDSLIRNQEEMQIIEHTLAQFKDGNTKKAFYAVLGGLTDYNDMMENAFRLSAYKVARDQGLSKQKAAIIAKNLTVNFDRKGALTPSANALFAFFNANVQGTERIYQTLKGPKGRMIIGGGILAGMIQALMLASAGYGDDDPPEFVREKNFIIPLLDGTYITVPYPLGYNILPNSGRIVMDFMIRGGRDPGKHMTSLMSSIMNSFNPLGSTGFSFQTLTPTALDPLVALTENKDAFGRPIYRPDRSTAPTPGYTRSRDTASTLGKGIAEFLNWASRGTKYQKGLISPTGDEVDFLAGQIGGGLYREISKAVKAIGAQSTGEALAPYQRPLVSRFYGETGSPAAVSQTFYNNVIRMTDHENEIKGRMTHREDVQSYLNEHPEARLWKRANTVENKINELNKRKRTFISRNFPKERIQAIDAQKTMLMQRFNDQVSNLTPE